MVMVTRRLVTGYLTTLGKAGGPPPQLGKVVSQQRMAQVLRSLFWYLEIVIEA